MICEGTDISTMHDLVVGMANNGFSIIPLSPFGTAGNVGKRPLVYFSEFILNKASPSQVSQWWNQNPDANMGILTGNGLIVLDADSDSAVSWVETNMPKTGWRVKSSRGVHFYYFCDSSERVRGGSNKNPKHEAFEVDIRGDGSVVTGPWSRHSSGCYYVPTIESEYPGTITIKQIDRCRQGYIPYDRTDVMDSKGNLCIKIRNICPLRSADLTKDLDPEGGRNNTIASMVGQLIRKDRTEIEIRETVYEVNSKWPHPLDSIELDTTIDSVIRTHTRKNPGLPVMFDKAKPNERKTFEFKEFDNKLVPGGLIGSLTDWIDSRSRRSSPMFSMSAAISLIALLMSRRYKDASHCKPNLFVVLVGASGSGKDNGMKSIIRALTKCGVLDRLSQGIGSDAALSHEMTQTATKLFCIDELGKVFSSMKGNNTASHKAQIISKMLKLYSGSSGLYKEDDLVGRKAASVQDPHLNIYGATTPEEFFPSFDKNSFTNGMMGRFLIFQARVISPPKRDRDISCADLPEELLYRLNCVRRIADSTTAIDHVIDGNVDPEYINVLLTDSADELSYQMALDYDVGVKTPDSTTDTIMRAIRSRAMEIVRKLALIYAVSDDPDGTIDDRHLLWAKSIVDLSINNVMACIDMWHHKSFKEMHSKHIVESISRTKGGLSYSDFVHTFRHLPEGQRAEIIKDLITSGVVTNADGRYTLTGV